MRGNPFRILVRALWCAWLLVAPSVALAEMDSQRANPPPVEQQLVREGDMAMRLAAALGLVAGDDEASAESLLAELGIEPRSGWIADYPVTPDIAGELRKAVAAAAETGKLSMGRDEALRMFDTVLAEAGLPLSPYTGTASYDTPPPVADSYLDSSVITDYYYGAGPPVVTYYAPPTAYYYLYAWVPYPFWCSGFLFPGFYVLHDFHRTVFVHHNRFIVTNHFRDWKTNRFYRVDPVRRFRGDSFVVKRGHDARAFVSSPGRRPFDRSFDRQRARSLPGGNTLGPRGDAGSVVGLPSSGSGRPDRHRFERTGSGIGPSLGVRSFNRPSFEPIGAGRQRFEGTGRGVGPSLGVKSFSRPSFEPIGGGRQRFEGTGGAVGPSLGVKSFSRPSFGSGGDRSHFRSNGISVSPSTGRSFGRPSSWGGSPTFRSGGGSFNSFSRGGGFSSGGRGGR